MAFEPSSNLRFQASPREVLAESSAAAFMAGVYRWMVVGLVVTAGVAFYVAATPAVFAVVQPHFFALAIAQLALVFGLSFAARRISGVAAGALFLAYAALNGLTFSVLFMIYQLGSLGQVFLITAGAFAGLAVYGTVTKRDLSGWRTFLFIGLFGVIIASAVNIFLHSPGLTFVMSCASVLVFGGLTAYDTQKLRQIHASSGFASVASLSIVGALTLYLDFINLFIALLNLFGRRRD